jgi:hypothetical protein
MRLLVYILALIALSASAAQRYVTTTGSDSADGSIGTPWLTIQHAADTASAGDVVNIGAGTFREYVTPSHNGSAGSPITFTGTRSGATWTTIIDPSTDVSAGWVAAPEIGTGVYKKTGLAFEAQVMTLNNQQLAGVYTMGDITDWSIDTYPGSGITLGSELLALTSSRVVTNSMTAWTNVFWDGIEAMYGFNSGTAYLRLRAGTDPSGLALRASANWDGHGSTLSVVKPIWNFSGSSYIVVSNLLMRGAFACASIGGTSHHINIESNYLANGFAKVEISGGSYDCTVRNNEMTDDYYGYATPGSYAGGSPSNAADLINGQLYVVGKFIMGANNRAWGTGVHLVTAGTNNIVCSNYMHGFLANGVTITSSGVPTTNTLVYANRISNSPSVGVLLSYGEVGTQVYDNLIENCNDSFRWNEMDRSTEVRRLVYIYRNRIWNRQDSGEVCYAHFWGPPVTPGCNPEFWVYNNTFSGGARGITISQEAVLQSGMPNCRFINNAFNCPFWVMVDSLTFWNTAAMIGTFDYNMVVPPPEYYPSSTPPAWFGANNKRNPGLEWSYASEPDFILHAGSLAIDNGQDLPTDDPTLPQDSTAKIGAAWDIGALEYDSGAPVAPSIVGQPSNQTVTSGGNATFSVTATGTATLHYQWYFGASTTGTDSATLTIAGATSSNAGSYHVVVTNGAGTATSSTVTLTVNSVLSPGQLRVGHIYGVPTP